MAPNAFHRRAWGVTLLALLLALLWASHKPVEHRTDLRVEPYAVVLPHYTLHRVTAYNAVVWQTNADPENSACGPTKAGQIAVSRDLLYGDVPCGTPIRLVTDDGLIIDGIVNDTMNVRYTNTADVLLDKLQDARNFGVKRGHIIKMQVQ